MRPVRARARAMPKTRKMGIQSALRILTKQGFVAGDDDGIMIVASRIMTKMSAVLVPWVVAGS